MHIHAHSHATFITRHRASTSMY